MRTRRALAAAAALTVTVAAPATAAPGDTSATFSVSTGGLSITAPGSASLGSATPKGSITAQIGTIQVTDNRALLTAAWTASVTSTSFTTGAALPTETVPNSGVSYWSGPGTANTGTGTFTPGQATASAAQTLSTSRTAFTLTAGVGNNTASWHPSLIVAVPGVAVSGTYTGTVTHSVA